jgi:ABC-type multidrug transport system ATPase subunit
MGRPFDEKRFAWAIETSAMQRDLDLLPFGSDTVVGERGTTLSGGQQARVSIARAVYAQPTLLVLDDPLAAVDAAVAQHIFSNIKVFVKADDSRAALVVLNQLQLLSEFDDIIYLEHGSISARGTYQQLLDMSASFCEFAASYQRRDADSGDLDDTEATDSIVSNETTSGTQKQVAREKGDETAAPVSAKQVVEDEKTQIGAVPIEVLLKWIRNAGTHRFAGVIVLLLCAYAAFACNDLWLGRWTHDVDAGKIKNQTESFTNVRKTSRRRAS